MLASKLNRATPFDNNFLCNLQDVTQLGRVRFQRDIEGRRHQRHYPFLYFGNADSRNMPIKRIKPNAAGIPNKRQNSIPQHDKIPPTEACWA